MAPAVTLRQEHLDAMIAHALEEAPNECCGMIGAREGRIATLYRAVNAEASPYRFSIDHREQRRIEEALDAAGETLAGFYHSHTGSPAPPQPDRHPHDEHLLRAAVRPHRRQRRRARPPRYARLPHRRGRCDGAGVRDRAVGGRTVISAAASTAARAYPAPVLTLRGRTFVWGARTWLMAIVNVTPDSFSGDGLGSDAAAAAALAREFADAGADLLDVGGESTRPGALPVTPADEAARVLPAIAALRAATDLPVSIDTQHAEVAEVALAEGADLVNDIHGLRGDERMADVVAAHNAALVAMHNQRGRERGDVIANVRTGWRESLRIAARAGVARERVILDPGFGFGWTPEENLELVRRLGELTVEGPPVLLGPSRKSTLGLVLDAPVCERLEGTAAAVALAIAGGADIVRVHDVAAMRKVAAVADAISRGRWRAP